MFRRDVMTLRMPAALAVRALVPALVLALVPAMSGVSSPARAAGGLEDVVGAIPAATRVLLPADPKLWGAYHLGETPDLCRSGSIGCVDDTIADMSRRFQPLGASCSHNAVFSLLYLRVTEGYKVVATTPGYFTNTPLVNKEDTDFARLYTRAYDLWYRGQPATVPPIWRLAFAAADGQKVAGSGDALLGMIGHIKRDLPFALWRIALGDRDDHLAINPMLKRVYPRVSAELGRRFDPTISPDGGRVPGTGELVVDAIATWRDQAWRDAAALLAARDSAQFTAVAMRVERSAWDLGLETYLGTRYTLQAQNAQRNAYCERQRTAA